MKIQTERNGEFIEVKRLVVIIGETKYRLSETSEVYKGDGNLVINKLAFDESSTLTITPRVSNEIIIK